MNKTVTINLSGIVFHIDENAYDTLKKYLESIRSKFTVADGRDEIVQDIEARIAEMFQQRLSDSKQAILPEDVNAVITILGKPEDISEAQETTTASATEPVAGEPVYNVKKRFFRSPDDKILGGVCGGISAYFDIDPIWLRLAFALAFFFGGSGFLIYIILWVIVPLAKTPSEKLQMHGEDVTLSAIQKSVQDELEGVKTKAGEMVSEMRSKNYGRRLSSFISDVVVMFFKFIGKLFSVVFILVSLVVLFVLTVLFGLGFHKHAFMLAQHVHPFIALTGLFLLLGVPAVLLLLAGLKGLFNTSWKLRKAAGILAGLMLIGVGICLITGINVFKNFASDTAITKSVAWQAPHGKTLRLALNPKTEPCFFQFGVIKSVSRYSNGSSTNFSVESGNIDSIIPVDVELYIEQSNTDSVQLVTTYYSKGANTSEARSLAEKIKYSFSYSDSTLNLDPYGSLEQKKIWRAQKVKLLLKVPLNTSVRIARNPNDYNYDFSIHADNDLGSYDFFGHTFTMTPDGLKCVDCNNTSDDDN